MKMNPKSIYQNHRKTRKISGISFFTVKPLKSLCFQGVYAFQIRRTVQIAVGRLFAMEVCYDYN